MSFKSLPRVVCKSSTSVRSGEVTFALCDYTSAAWTLVKVHQVGLVNIAGRCLNGSEWWLC